mgnify:CR=1 FL=1
MEAVTAQQPSVGQVRMAPTRWVGLDDLPIVFTNQFVGQIDDRGEIILSLGAASPPLIVPGWPEEIVQQAAKIESVAVKPALSGTSNP